MSNNNRLSPAHSGFTLIELLVTTAIMVLVVGGGIAGFIGFNDRQTIISAVDVTKEALQVAQSKANSGELGGCSKLKGWKVVNGNTQIQVQSICTNLAVGTTKAYTLPTGVTASFNPNSTILFNVLSGPIELTTNPSGYLDITLTQGGNNSYLFGVDQGGQVTSGDWI